MPIEGELKTSREKVLAGLDDYLHAPSPEKFRLLQQTVAASPDYSPYGVSFGNAGKLFKEGKFAEAESVLKTVFWNYVLSPRLHLMLGIASDKQGNQMKARMGFGMANRCVEGILSTGTGHRDKPYRVLHVEEEYDVMDKLGKKVKRQALVKADGQHFDMLECEDGSTVYFDIAIPHGRLGRQVSPPPAS